MRAAPDAEAGRRRIERSLSRALAGLVSPAEVEAVRGRIVALPSVPERPTLKRDDLLAALAIFLTVVASTFPVVLPFVLISDVGTAKTRSRAIAVADRGPLHLEARYDYESIGARSAFAGWTFSGGEEIAWELTPLLGGAWGTTRAFVPALEASVAWRRVDFYVEAEYVRGGSARTGSYFYAWSELGFRPAEWLRIGIAGQRTRAYGGERDIQRGPFAQPTWGRLTLGGYWFNPGSSDQVFVGLIGAKF